MGVRARVFGKGAMSDVTVTVLPIVSKHEQIAKISVVGLDAKVNAERRRGNA